MATVKLREPTKNSSVKPDDIVSRGCDTPTLKLLSKYVKPVIAPYWLDLGLQLLEEKNNPKLNIIEKNNPKDIEACCQEMFEYWLRVDERASWDKLISALQAIGQNTLAANIKQNILKGYPLEPPAVPQKLLQPPLVELQPPQGDDQPPPVVVNSNPSVVAEDGNENEVIQPLITEKESPKSSSSKVWPTDTKRNLLWKKNDDKTKPKKRLRSSSREHYKKRKRRRGYSCSSSSSATDLEYSNDSSHDRKSRSRSSSRTRNSHHKSERSGRDKKHKHHKKTHNSKTKHKNKKRKH